MSQYLVWVLLWLCVCLMPVGYDRAKFGVTKIRSTHYGVPEFFRNARFVSVSGFILFPLSTAIFWVVVLVGWAVFQDLTYARWNGSLLGVMSLSIVFLAMGTVIRYLSVGHIRGRDPDGRVLLQYVGVRPFVVIGIILLLVGSNITPLMGNLEFNPLFKDLNESAENTDAP
ncbi:MAG: hypothetical protein QF883_03160, partial [Candidatus Poseidoniia archaeon]|nr:hypothetical protein [Candidatus Poseidoniia archaeon]